MELNYDPLWDERGELRRGCTVREALDWLTSSGSHSAGESCCVNGVAYKIGRLLYGPRRKKFRSAPSPLSARTPPAPFLPPLPPRSADLVGAAMPAVADKPIFRVYDGYYRQLNFCV